MRSLVFQLAPEQRPEWYEPCLDSVRRWAAAEGFQYRLYGDEAFERVPPSLREKCGGRMPMLADLARLAVARALLEREGWERVIYADADFLIWDGRALQASALEHGSISPVPLIDV